MANSTSSAWFAAALLMLNATSAVCAEGASNDRISIRAIAEVETQVAQNGRVVSKLAPADRLVPGDQVIYTLEIRNISASALPPTAVDYAVPQHVRYVADSATGPGADISYSIDGGHTYDRPENLKVPGDQGVKRVAGADEYTHIRWQLKNVLKVNSVAFARFRAVVK